MQFYEDIPNLYEHGRMGRLYALFIYDQGKIKKLPFLGKQRCLPCCAEYVSYFYRRSAYHVLDSLHVYGCRNDVSFSCSVGEDKAGSALYTAAPRHFCWQSSQPPLNGRSIPFSKKKYS